MYLQFMQLSTGLILCILNLVGLLLELDSLQLQLLLQLDLLAHGSFLPILSKPSVVRDAIRVLD